ncbi:uncharacterized [Tachysurus ichikawai]
MEPRMMFLWSEGSASVITPSRRFSQAAKRFVNKSPDDTSREKRGGKRRTPGRDRAEFQTYYLCYYQFTRIHTNVQEIVEYEVSLIRDVRPSRLYITESERVK